MPKLLMILAEGFEETEAVAVADVLLRLDFKLTFAALENLPAAGAHGIRILPDAVLRDVRTDEFDGIVLPGGMPGAERLLNSAEVLAAVRKFDAQSKPIAAICAAPIVLARAGALKGRAFTIYPGFESYLGDLEYTDSPSERDGHIITGRGPGAVWAFAQKIAEAFGLDKEVRKLYEGMFVSC